MRAEQIKAALKAHKPGEWREVNPATETGEERYGRFCTCGVLVDFRDPEAHQAEVIAALIALALPCADPVSEFVARENALHDDSCEYPSADCTCERAL